MADVAPVAHAGEKNQIGPAEIAKLRGLVRSGFDVKAFLRSTTAVEIASLVALMLVVAGCFVIYSFWILPDQVRFVQMSGEVDLNKSKIAELQREVQNPDEIRSTFERVKASLDEFQGGYLKPRGSGRIEIIRAIDDGCKATGTRLASDVTFISEVPVAMDEQAPREGQKQAKRSSKRQSGEVRIFPKLEMTFQVSGTYKQLREFLHRFESHRQFVVIQGVSISAGEEEAEETESRPGRRSGGSRGSGTPGELTLEIAVTAYFQPTGQPLPVDTAALK